MPAGNISIEFGARGPNSAPATACAAGSHAIGDAYHIIRRGTADGMITGGVESVITPLALAGFGNMRALSTRNDKPQKASRPFDKDRDGFVIAEGGGIIILEELDHALNRGAKIYAEIVGYGMSADAYHITAPEPNGEGFVGCMEMALGDAHLTYRDVDCINAHGTSTGLNDLCETVAIKKVFRERSKEIAISSTKSMTGHLLGGAGGLESIFSVLTIRDGIIPPTINYETPDPECDLDYVPNAARKAKVDVIMTNSFGFGGTNASLIFRRFEM
jgi:3-oxoacyl-[acyl-carrier-protein] synthase II